MNRLPTKTRTVLTVALLLGVLVGANQVAAQEGGVIHGQVWIDANANLVRDADELPMPGVDVIVANGQTGWQLQTGGDGSYRIDVPNGNWQVALMVPEGYAPANDATREVSIGPESTLDATLDFALLSMNVAAPLPDGQAPTATATVPVVLPQTGSPIAPSVVITLGLAGLLAMGLLLIGFGRWAAARR